MKEQIKIISLLTLMVLSTGTLGYLLNEVFTEDEVIHVYHYELDEGKDGIIQFSLDQDSLAYVVYVQEGDTFALDCMVRSEFDSLTQVLYNDSTSVQ